MGCGASTDNAPLNETVVYLEAFNKSRRANPPLKPLTKQGLDAQLDMTTMFRHLEENIRILPAGDQRSRLLRGLDVVVKSEYVQNGMCLTTHPTRSYDGKWIKFDYPDNGHWKIGKDSTSGSIALLPAHTIIGVSITFTCGPMRSQVDSAGYAKMFQENIEKNVFSRLPNMVNNQYILSGSHTAPEPFIVDGNEFRCWHQLLESVVTAKQLEVHGMRNEDPNADRKSHFYGFNASCCCPNAAMYAAFDELFHVILASVTLADADTWEAEMGKFWDKLGR